MFFFDVADSGLSNMHPSIVSGADISVVAFCEAVVGRRMFHATSRRLITGAAPIRRLQTRHIVQELSTMILAGAVYLPSAS